MTVSIPSAPAAELLDARAAAALLGCSARHLKRLADAGDAPPPRKLGRLVRWARRDLESWIAAGCRRKGGVA
jgi:excisionase family DNA binding protein